MRRHRHARMRPERMRRRQRLLAENIQRRMRQMPRIQRRQQSRVVDERPAPRIDHHRAARQGRERLRVHHRRRPRRRRQQQHQDLRGRQHLAEPLRPRIRRDPVQILRPPAPAMHPKADPRQHPRRGGPEGAETEHAHAALARQRRNDPVAPDAVLSQDMRVRAEMMAQNVPRDPFRHSGSQALVDHPHQRRGQRRIVHEPLDPGPEAQYRLQPLESRELRHRAARPMHDVIDRSAIRRGQELGLQTLRRAGRPQMRRVERPPLRRRGKQDPWRHQSRPRGRCTCALCTSPNAASSTSIADPP